MKNSVFIRVEKKYVLNKEKYDLLMERLKNYIKIDKYGLTTICNIYFDTEDSDLIKKSIEKPIYKEKLRLRSYGIPKLDDTVFLEIKKKYNGIVNKRRINITLKNFYKYLKNKEQLNNEQIMKEIDFCFKKYKLVPSMYIAYERCSYKALEDENLRITFDTNLRSRDYDLQLEKGDYGETLNKEIYLMEVKTLNSMPIWFVKILSELEIYPGSFSKYGNIYKNKFNKKANYLSA